MRPPEKWSKSFNKFWARGVSLDIEDGDYNSIELFIAAIQTDALKQAARERAALKKLVNVHEFQRKALLRGDADYSALGVKWHKAWANALKAVRASK